MSNAIEKLKYEVEAKWLPIFESWTTSKDDESPNPIHGQDWIQEGKPSVEGFRRFIQNVGKALPKESVRMSIFLRKIDGETRVVDSYNEMAIEACQEWEEKRDSILAYSDKEINFAFDVYDGFVNRYQELIVGLRSVLLEVCGYILALGNSYKGMRCPECGKPMASEARFCSFCGAKLRK